MDWNTKSGAGDSGAELPILSDDEDGRSSQVTNHSSQHQLLSTALRTTGPPLKEPWVPAPGKTSKVRSRSRVTVTGAMSLNQLDQLSSCENSQHAGRSVASILSGRQTVSSAKRQRKARSRTKRSRSIDERKMSGYTLQSKDSLIDITASLNKKRDEVFKLWEHNVLNCDSDLLLQLETANMLAIETANDINELRKTIDNYKKKSAKLSTEDEKALTVFRVRILSKLKRFEESHAYIQKSLKVSRDSSRNPRSVDSKQASEHESPGNTGRKTSRESVRSKKSKSVRSSTSKSKSPAKSKVPSERSSSLVYLKTIAESFDNGDTDNEVDYEDFDDAPGETKAEPSKVTSDIEEVRDKPESAPEEKRQGKERTAKSKSRSRPSATEAEALNSAFLVDRIYYRDKIRGLHRKLIEQESKCVEMRREMKRMQSENSYDIKMLKSSMKAQMEDMGHLPEMLQVTENRLNDSLHAKFAIESTLQLKLSEITALKVEIGRLEKELEQTQVKVAKFEAKNETLTEKLERLENENKELRMEIVTKTQMLATSEANNARSHAAAASASPKEGKPKRDHRVLLLEDKISELEAELESANKETLAMRRAKHDTTIQLNRRIDELVDGLEESRSRTRTLQTGINLIKTKYYEVFYPNGTRIGPEEMFPELTKVLANIKQVMDSGPPPPSDSPLPSPLSLSPRRGASNV